jgi:hypothetical protein
MEMFLEFVRAHPAKFIGLVLMRFLIALVPMAVVAKSTGAVLSAWYAKGAVLASVILAAPVVKRHTLWRIAPWLAFAGYWTVMQSLAGAGLRYRLPADPAWACILGVLCSVIVSDLRLRRKKSALAL